MTFVGLVYRAENGLIHTHVGPRMDCQHWLLHNSTSNLLSLISGPNEAIVADAANGVMGAEANFANEQYFDRAEPQGDYFVYTYFRNCAVNWDNVFYIGKGQGKRDIQHIIDVIRNGAITSKQRLIKAALVRLRRQTGLSVNNIADYRAAIAVVADGRTLVRKVFSCTSEFTSFCIEHHLISAKYGAYNVSNETNGNGHFKNTESYVLSRPSAYNQALLHHREWWNTAHEAFVSNGDLPASTSALLLLMSLEPLVPVFDQHIQNQGSLHGLLETAARPQNRKGPPQNHLQHLWVENGQDVTINYRVVGYISPANEIVATPHLPFRIELVASRKEPAIAVNLRPLENTRTGKNEFINYIRQRVGAYYATDALSNAAIAPFFKPYAPGGEGRYDTAFTYRAPYGRARSGVGKCWPDWHPDGHNQHLAFNVVDAVRAILRYLTP